MGGVSFLGTDAPEHVRNLREKSGRVHQGSLAVPSYFVEIVASGRNPSFSELGSGWLGLERGKLRLG